MGTGLTHRVGCVQEATNFHSQPNSPNASSRVSISNNHLHGHIIQPNDADTVLSPPPPRPHRLFARPFSRPFPCACRPNAIASERRARQGVLGKSSTNQLQYGRRPTRHQSTNPHGSGSRFPQQSPCVRATDTTPKKETNRAIRRRPSAGFSGS